MEGSAFWVKGNHVAGRRRCEGYLKVTRQTREQRRGARGTMMRCFSSSCVYFNLSLLVHLIFLFFLLSSLRCKVACLVTYSFLHLLVCFLSFQVASERGSDFVTEFF